MRDQLGSKLELALEVPFPTRADVERLCRQAVEAQNRAVVVPSGCVATAANSLETSNVKVDALIGFPFGSNDPDAKRYETELAIDSGAQGIELVPCIGRLRDGDYTVVLRELRDVVEAADERLVKIVLESGYWSDSVLSEIVQLILDSGAQFISAIGRKGPATTDEIRKLRDFAGRDFGIKASSLNTGDDLEAYVSAGANVLGYGNLFTAVSSLH